MPKVSLGIFDLGKIGIDKFHKFIIFFIRSRRHPEIARLAVNLTDLFQIDLLLKCGRENLFAAEVF